MTVASSSFLTDNDDRQILGIVSQFIFFSLMLLKSRNFLTEIENQIVGWMKIALIILNFEGLATK